MQKQLQKKVEKKLTKQQELYVLALLRGLSQRQAYYEAYPKSRAWADNSVDNKASVLYRNAKVKARLEELNNKLMQKQEKKTIYDAQQLREFWTSILLDADSGMQNRIKASELLAKAQGMFVEKRETSIKSEDCVIRISKNVN